MEETLISFETAKLAKEKGFKNESCVKCLVFDKTQNKELELYYNETLPLHDNFTMLGLLPTQSLLQKWLRDIHKLHIYIETTPEFDKTQGSKYKSAVKVAFQPFRWTTAHYYLGDTYEEALEAAIFKALSLIKNK